jgi:hypothetical protein
MNLIIDKNIFLKYLSNLGPKTKSQNISWLIKIFEDTDNKILLSKNIVDRMEIEINSDTQLLYFFQSFIKDIYDSGRYESINTSSVEEKEEILEIFDSYTGTDCQFGLIGEFDHIYAKNLIFISRSCFFNTINRPNKCWLIFNLLANRTVSVRYNDFRSNREIERYFFTFFNLPSFRVDINIIDSYCNISNHSLFVPLSKKGYTVNIYTSAANKSQFEKDLLKKELKEYFGKKNTHVKFSTDKSLVHERTISIGEFILESNHDFAEVKTGNQNWKIDISIDRNFQSEIFSKCQSYN